MDSRFEKNIRNAAVALLALATVALTNPAVASANGVKSSVAGSIKGGGTVIVKIAGRKVQTSSSGLFSISGKNLAGKHKLVFKSNGKGYKTFVDVSKGSRLSLQNVSFNSDGTASSEAEDVKVSGTLTAVDCGATPNTLTVTPSGGGTPVLMSFDPATTHMVDESTGTPITTCGDLAADVNDPAEAEGQQDSSGGIVANEVKVNPASEDDAEDVSLSGTVSAENCPSSISVDTGGGTVVVNISASTKIDLEGSDGQNSADCSSIPQGAQVDVEGVPQPDGSVNADKIEVMENEFESDGTINSTDCVDSKQSLSFTPDGTSSALTVTIGSTTQIEVNGNSSASCTDLTAGAARVEGVTQQDGSVAARKIEQGSGGDD